MNRPDDVNDVIKQLSSLAPTASETPRPPQAALAHLRQQIAETSGTTTVRPGRSIIMFKRNYAVPVFLALLVLIVAFALPPVRAAASEFLGLFRVQKFAAISVSPRQVELLRDLADQGLYPGEFEVLEEPEQSQTFASLDEARQVTGLTIHSASGLPEADSISVNDGGKGRLVVDVEQARAILEAAEVDPALLPDSLEGATVDVTTYPAVEQVWGDWLRLVQTASPLVDYPDDVNPTLLGQALLQLLGMTPDEARRLANDIDWSSTLILPVPQDLATFSEVSINGNSGLALSSVDGSDNSLMWQSDGAIYILVGDPSVEQLQEIAESIR